MQSLSSTDSNSSSKNHSDNSTRVQSYDGSTSNININANINIMESSNCSVSIDRKILEKILSNTTKPIKKESSSRKHSHDGRSCRRRKSMLKSRDMIIHKDKGDVLEIYLRNKKLYPGRCMKKTVAEITGTSTDDITLEDYNNYRNMIYGWKNNPKLAKDSIKKNGLNRKICYPATNEKKRFLNQISREIIKRKLQDCRRKWKTRVSKKQIKAMIDQRVEVQIKEAIARGDWKEVQRLLGFKNSDTHFYKLMKDLRVSRQKTGVSKSVRGERISSLKDPALSEEDRVQWEEFVHKIWYYICIYGITRDRIASGDTTSGFLSTRGGYTYCDINEGATLHDSTSQAGKTFSIFGNGYADGSPGELCFIFPTTTGSFGPGQLKKLTENPNNGNVLILASKSGKMGIKQTQALFTHIGWREKRWIQTLDSYTTYSSPGCANFVSKVCNGILVIVPATKSYLGNVYDIVWFGPLNYLLQLKEIDFRNDLASKQQNANRTRSRQEVIDHTKEVWFTGHEEYRDHIISGWIKNWIMLSWDGSVDLLASEHVFLPKGARLVKNVRTEPESLVDRMKMRMPSGPVAKRPITNEIIVTSASDGSVQVQIDQLKLKFGERLRRNFVNKYPGLIKKSTTFPKTSQDLIGLCNKPSDYHNFQYATYIPPLETLDGKLYKTKWTDYENICGAGGYPFIGCTNKWPDNTAVIIGGGEGIRNLSSLREVLHANGKSGDSNGSSIPYDFSMESSTRAMTFWRGLPSMAVQSLKNQNLNHQDIYSVITVGEYMTDSVLRAYLLIMNKSQSNGNFYIETDTLQLQQLGKQHRLRVNSGTLLHVGGNHYAGVACKDEARLDYCDSLNPIGINETTKSNLSKMKPLTAKEAAIKKVTQQVEVECGGFGLAFLTHYLFGLDPSDYEFKQSSIRHHTASCIIHQRISPYPSKRVERILRERRVPI